jgi:hypothetical protein
MEGKDKILDVKWDSLCKHVSQRKTKNNIGTNVKRGDWYYSKYCKHAKNHKLLASHNHRNVATQPANGMVRENQKKVVQFAIVLHLPRQGHPMQEYEVIKPLYEFLPMPTKNKKH